MRQIWLFHAALSTSAEAPTWEGKQVPWEGEQSTCTDSPQPLLHTRRGARHTLGTQKQVANTVLHAVKAVQLRPSSGQVSSEGNSRESPPREDERIPLCLRFFDDA